MRRAISARVPRARALAAPRPQEFKAELEELEEHAARLARLFGEDAAEVEPQTILSTLSMFLKRLEKAADDVRRRRPSAAERANGRTPGHTRRSGSMPHIDAQGASAGPAQHSRAGSRRPSAPAQQLFETLNSSGGLL